MKSALLVTVRFKFWCAYFKGGLAGKHGCGLARPDGDQSLTLSLSPCTDFSASEEGPRESVDAGCRNLMAPRDSARKPALLVTVPSLVWCASSRGRVEGERGRGLPQPDGAVGAGQGAVGCVRRAVRLLRGPRECRPRGERPFDVIFMVYSCGLGVHARPACTPCTPWAPFWAGVGTCGRFRASHIANARLISYVICPKPS